MRHLRALFALLAACAGLGTPLPSIAYDTEGHFYTVIALARLSKERSVPDDYAVLYGFCAQLPDLAKELDATTLRWEIGSDPRWGILSQCPNDATRRMVQAHRLVHALAGSKADDVTKAAVEIVKRLRLEKSEDGDIDPNRACAVGLGLHLLGDSFAHRRLNKPTETYETGGGHFLDMHVPDYIAYTEARGKLWQRYVQKLVEVLELKIDKGRLDAVDRIASGNVMRPNADYRPHQNAIITALLHLLRQPAPDEKLLWDPYIPRLEDFYSRGTHFLDKSFDDVVEAYRDFLPASPNYNEVWKIYLPVALAEFRRAGIPDPSPSCSRE